MSKKRLLDDVNEREEAEVDVKHVAPEKITLDIGGTRYTTLKSTLLTFPNTFLGTMFSPANASLLRPDNDGSFFFDRNGRLFEYVLDFYRTRKLYEGSSDEEREKLVEEYQFWGLIAQPPPLLYGRPYDEKTAKLVESVACKESSNDSRPTLFDFVVAGINFYAFFDGVRLIVSVTDRDAMFVSKHGICAKSYSPTYNVGVHCCIPHTFFARFTNDFVKKNENDVCYVCASQLYEILSKFLTMHQGETYQFALRCRITESKGHRYLHVTLFYADVGEEISDVKRFSRGYISFQHPNPDHSLGFPSFSQKPYASLCLKSEDLRNSFDVFKQTRVGERIEDNAQVAITLSSSRLMISTTCKEKTKCVKIESKADVILVNHDDLQPICGKLDTLLPRKGENREGVDVAVIVNMRRLSLANFVANMSKISSKTYFCTLADDKMAQFSVVISHRIGVQDEISFDVYFQ